MNFLHKHPNSRLKLSLTPHEYLSINLIHQTKSEPKIYFYILGEIYAIRIVYVVQPLGSEKEVESEPLVGTFLTKPLPATNFSIGEEENSISFQKSPTTSVRYV